MLVSISLLRPQAFNIVFSSRLLLDTHNLYINNTFRHETIQDELGRKTNKINA